MLIRFCDYLNTYGIYPKQSEIACEGNESIDPAATQISLGRMMLDPSIGRVIWDPVRTGDCWQVTFQDRQHFSLTIDLTPGYYLFLVRHNDSCCGMPIVIDDRQRAADVAVIRPVFTQWSYHREGFYLNEEDLAAGECRKGAKILRRVDHLIGHHLCQWASRLGFRSRKGSHRSFPARPSVNLGGFYRRNNRWDKTIWDREWGKTEGLWCDEILCGIPVFALLDKNRVSYHVFTDIDLHRQNEALKNYRVLIFSGQEGITASYYQMMKGLQAGGKTSFLLWGVQGFGYRQLNYRSETGELEYVCTRGRHGMWGDALEDREPDWGDEADLFGFHFPEPASALWRHEVPFSEIRIAPSNHPIVKLSGPSGHSYRYEITDANGQSCSGLIWAGGEFQRRVAPEAKVIAQLDGDPQTIGIGEYRNTILFSPTYLPAFFAYQNEHHPEVEAWFISALHYLLKGSGS